MRLRAYIGIAILLLVLVVGGVGWFVFVRAERGSGEVVTQTRNVSGFDEVELSGAGSLAITQGDKEALSIEAEDNIIPHITTRVEGNRLKIGYERRWLRPLHPTRPVTFFLSVKDLSAVDLSGTGMVQAPNIRTTRLKIDVSGSGSVDLPGLTVDELETDFSGSAAFNGAGKADKQKVTISGSGLYTAQDLESTDAQIDVSGSGRATVRVSGSLNVDISGSGTVEYIGNPSINQDISGSGSLTRIEDNR